MLGKVNKGKVIKSIVPPDKKYLAGEAK